MDSTQITNDEKIRLKMNYSENSQPMMIEQSSQAPPHHLNTAPIMHQPKKVTVPGGGCVNGRDNSITVNQLAMPSRADCSWQREAKIEALARESAAKKVVSPRNHYRPLSVQSHLHINFNNAHHFSRRPISSLDEKASSYTATNFNKDFNAKLTNIRYQVLFFSNLNLIY